MTSLAPGATRFFVTMDVKDSATGTHILIPQGSYGMLEQQGRALVGDERMTVVAASELSWPDGTPIKLTKTSVADVTGMPGFADLLDRRTWQNIGAALFTGVLRLGTVAPVGYNGGIAERAGMSVATETGQQAAQQVKQAINTSPRMTVRNGYQGALWLREPLNFSRAYVRER